MAKSEEVAPEMRGAINRACTLLGLEPFVKDPGQDVPLADERAVGMEQGACARSWFHRFC